MDVSETKFVEQQRTCEFHGAYTVKLFAAEGRAPHGYTRCPKCDQETLERRKKLSEEQRLRQVEVEKVLRHERSRIPLRFKNRRFENYVVESLAQAKALKVCRWYADGWDMVRQTGVGLIFSGKAGAGKTHLACSIAHDVIERGGEVTFATVAEVMRKIKSSFAKDSETTEQKEIDYFSGIKLLILDEVGMDYGTDFNKALIFEILNNRYENMLPTILITNLDAAALKEYMGERLIDRMREGGGRMVSFTWDSYRSKTRGAQE